MDLFNSIKQALYGKIAVGITPGEFFANLLIALFLIILGIFLGKIIKFLLRKIVEKLHISKVTKPSFVNLFLVVLKWSIYILFIDLALIQMNIPAITSWLTTILGVIPALTGALIIVSAGFAIAVYLRKVIIESKVDGWQVLSQIFFYFIIYIFTIFSLKTALVSVQDKMLSDVLTILFAFLGGTALIIYHFANQKH